MSVYSSGDEEYDSDEPPKLDVNLDKLMDRATEVLGPKCTTATPLTRGSSYEIFVLRFQASDTDKVKFDSLIASNYTCIARLARVKGNYAQEESEIATIRYLQQHTSIPVPDIYYHDLGPDNGTGAAFMLMQRLPGRHLYRSWNELSLDHKKAALSQIASVVAQLASLSFDKIGCLTDQGLGPIINDCLEQPIGPFESEIDYLQAFIAPERTEPLALEDLFGEIRARVTDYMRQNKSPGMRAPFTLIHADLDGQNMLFSDAPDGSGPRLTGIIDFEQAYTGPIYFLYEYPLLIQDVDLAKDSYEDNSVLRAHFVEQVFLNLPNQETQEMFIACMNSKNYVLNDFHSNFIRLKWSDEILTFVAEDYLEALKEGNRPAYSGRMDYQPEYYSPTGQRLWDKVADPSSPPAEEAPESSASK